MKDATLRRLEANDPTSWSGLADDERRAIAAHIDEGYAQAERGELLDRDQAQREIQMMKEQWRRSKHLAKS